jgi:hypothetical protein
MPDSSKGKGHTKCNPWSFRLGVGLRNSTPEKSTVTNLRRLWRRPRPSVSCRARKEERIIRYLVKSKIYESPHNVLISRSCYFFVSLHGANIPVFKHSQSMLCPQGKVKFLKIIQIRIFSNTLRLLIRVLKRGFAVLNFVQMNCKLQVNP